MGGLSEDLRHARRGGLIASQATIAARQDAIPWVALGALVAVAAVARGIGLNGGLWIDEVYSLLYSFRSPVSRILTEYWGDNHHPLYALLAHATRGVFGESSWSVRLPSVLFGVATVPALFLLARRLLSQREALLASALLAVSYHHVWFSQNARGYSAIAFFTVVLTGLALRGLSGSQPRVWYWYAVVSALAAFTHLTAVLVVLGHAAAVAVTLMILGRARAGRGIIARRAVIGFVPAAVLTLALNAAMLPHVIDYFVNRPSVLVGVSTTRWAVLETVRVLLLGLSGGVLAAGIVALTLGAVCVGSGVLSLWRRSPEFVLLLALPVFMTIAGAAIARGTMYPRFFFFAIGPTLIVVVRGAFAVAEWIAQRSSGRFVSAERLGTIAIGAVVILSTLSLAPNYRYPKQDFEGAMRYVLGAKGPSDAVVSTGVPADPYTQLWNLPWPNVENVRQLEQARDAAPRTWVLYTFPRYLESRSPDIAAVIQRECRPARVFRGTVGGGDIVVCTLEKA